MKTARVVLVTISSTSRYRPRSPEPPGTDGWIQMDATAEWYPDLTQPELTGAKHFSNNDSLYPLTPSGQCLWTTQDPMFPRDERAATHNMLDLWIATGTQQGTAVYTQLTGQSGIEYGSKYGGTGAAGGALRII
jgi:hypothetical protein